MLVKFGRVGDQVREYLVEDGYTVEDLLDIANDYAEDDDVVMMTVPGLHPQEIEDLGTEVVNGALYIISTVTLTENERKLCDYIENTDMYVEDMNITEKKRFVADIVEMVEDNWDR